MTTRPDGMMAAPTTVEAVMHSLRERGEAAMAEPACQRRLAELSAGQVRDVIERLGRLRPKYPAITDNLLVLVRAFMRETVATAKKLQPDSRFR
jgi:hypothetical protein